VILAKVVLEMLMILTKAILETPLILAKAVLETLVIPVKAPLDGNDLRAGSNQTFARERGALFRVRLCTHFFCLL
jgi:hypothetical protein